MSWREELIRDYESGTSVKNLSVRYCVTITQVRSVLTASGVEIRKHSLMKRNSNKWDRKFGIMILEAVSERESKLEKQADILGVSPMKLNQLFKGEVELSLQMFVDICKKFDFPAGKLIEERIKESE